MHKRLFGAATRCFESGQKAIGRLCKALMKAKGHILEAAFDDGRAFQRSDDRSETVAALTERVLVVLDLPAIVNTTFNALNSTLPFVAWYWSPGS